MEYIIDGTNIININEERSLTPLLNLVLGLMDRRASFICYFDFTTKRAHLTDWLNRKIYDLITTQSPAENASAFFGNGRFIQAIQTKKADELILRSARELKNAYVISRDLYRQEAYENGYGWTEEDRKHRLCSVDIIDNELLLIYKDIERMTLPYEKDVLALATELINRLEDEKGTLEGRIVEFDDQRRVGKIQLPEKRGRKIRFRDKTVKNAKLNYRKKGLEVSFTLEPHVITNDEPKKNTVLFEAGNLIEILDPQKALQKAREDNRNLIQELDELQHELAIFQEENLQLQEEVETLKQQIAELQAAGDSRQVIEVERLLAESEKQQSVINGLEVGEKNYRSEIDELKARINVLENITQFYQSNEYDTPKGVKEFWFEDSVSSEGLFSIYEGFEKPIVSQAKDEMLNEKEYLTKINLLEQEIEQLKAEISVISGQNTAYSSRIRTFARYGLEEHGGYYSQKNQINFLNQEIYDLKATVSQLRKELNGGVGKESSQKGLGRKSPEITVKETGKIRSQQTDTTNSKSTNSNILIDDAKILDWWDHLTPDWRHAFENKFVISQPPSSTKELQRILTAKSLHLVGDDYPTMGFGVSLPFTLEELSGLKDLHELEEVNLSFNRITNIVGLLHLKKLRKLNLTHNKIQNIYRLRELSELESLDLSSNPINPKEVENLQRMLPKVKIEFR